jgi:hypothetical protein
MIWRQEFEDCPSIIRTSEVRFAGTAPNGPYESHDLSAFCTREEHAVKVGAYILSKRVRSTHTIRFKVRPQSHNTLVTQGSLVRVRLERNPFGGSAGFHDYHYEVERITKTLAGDVQYECSHAPVGEDLRSLIAVDVANAQDSMTFFECNFTGVGCDVNPFDDTTPLPDDEFLIPELDPIGEIPPLDPGEFPIDIGDPGDPGDPGGGGSDGGGTTLPDSNPDDGIDKRPSVLLGCPNPAQGFYEGQPPLGVPPNIPTIGVFGNLDENGDIIPESIVRIPRIGFSIPFTPPPELGPNISGRDDWNNRFASFEYPGDDGITYITDPCNLLDVDDSPPPGDQALGYSQPVNVTVNIVWSYQLDSTPCNLITPPSSENESGTASIALSSVVKLYMATTGEPGSGLVLPATGGPAPPHAPSGAECGSSGSYRRNAFLLSEDDTGSIIQTGVYGSNQFLFASISYTGSHTSRITSVILNESVEGIGDAGDDITELGLASNTPYPIS